ncbi:rhomboid family intramembrane serine protease [Alteromonas facilis]|uniref:rhomboid family intramembrane serine protease n=1 Tax=Alteromonas facilis TaxID=2048004 RepID=UPI000C288F39|nr:rhomboid family intramembrane serine protease [Alteromonas facilis]
MKKAIGIAVLFTALLWVIQSAAVLFHFNQAMFGLQPLNVASLWGIFTAPLVHGGYEHLFNNTLPMIILLAMLWYGYPNTRGRVFSVIWIVSGVGVWLFARTSTHLGASGLTHGLFFFLFTVSLFRRDKRSVVLMMIAFFMYGGMVMTIFPREPGISYEYHFFGALAGFISALIWHRQDPKFVSKQYAWETEGYEDDDIRRIGDEWKIDHQHAHGHDERHGHSQGHGHRHDHHHQRHHH